VQYTYKLGILNGPSHFFEFVDTCMDGNVFEKFPYIVETTFVLLNVLLEFIGDCSIRISRPPMLMGPCYITFSTYSVIRW